MVVSVRELEDRPYQPLRATGHGDANGLMSANGGPGSRSWLIRNHDNYLTYADRAGHLIIVQASGHQPGGAANVSASLAAMSSIAWSPADSTPQKFKNACIVASYSACVTSTPSASRRAA